MFGTSNGYSKKYNFELGVGIWPIGKYRSKTLSTHFAIGKNVFKSKLSIRSKNIIWYYSNEYNNFLNFFPTAEIAIPVTLKKKIRIGNSAGANFQIAAGMGYNFVLYYKRKTFKEVGWPREIQPNVSFLFFIK